MTEQTTAPAEQKPADALPEAKQSLEQLYADYNVGTEPEGEAPQTAVTATPEQTPGDQGDSALREQLAAIQRRLDMKDSQDQQALDEADLNKAVATLGKEAGIDGKEGILRGYLIAKAQEDGRLRALWDARNRQPKAWNQALKILSDEVREEFDIANPQLEENQRAMDESQRAQSTTRPAPDSPEEKVMRMDDGDFGHFWARLAGRG